MNPNIRPTRAAGRQIIAGAAFASMLLASCSGTSADTSAAQPAADTAATANEASIATPGDQWEQVSPEDAGFDKAALDKLAESAEAASSNCLFVTKGGTWRDGVAAQLIASTKDQVEHRVVIDMIHDTLLPWCSYLDWEPEPSIMTVADRVAFLYQGRVHALATPAALAASPDPIVQQFIAGRSSGPMETPGF